MAHPVLHFEIMSPDATKLREFYRSAFDWKFAEPMPTGTEGGGDYSTIAPEGEHGIGGGIGQTTNGYPGHLTFYVYSDDLEATLKKVESLGGKRVMNPSSIPNMTIEIALFQDPAGNTIGLVNPHETQHD
jgi:uncharacterized protein